MVTKITVEKDCEDMFAAWLEACPIYKQCAWNWFSLCGYQSESKAKLYKEKEGDQSDTKL